MAQIPPGRVATYGDIAEHLGRRHFETPHVMEERLRSEGVEFVDEHRVALDKHCWRPGEGE